jgi:hypothetical protein
MKVKDMIRLLSTAPPDARIVIRGFESGFDKVKNLTYINIIKDPDWGPGTAFLDGEFIEADEEEASEVAVYIAGV